MPEDRPSEEKRDLFEATGELKGVYDLSMARARALEHAQKTFGKTVKGRNIPIIWDVEKAAFNEDDDCFDIVLSCHPEEGEYLHKGEWVYHVSPKGELLPGTPLLRSSLRLKEEARHVSPLLIGAVAAVVLVLVLAIAALAGGLFGGGAGPAPTATPTVAAVVPPVAKPTPTPTAVPAPTRLTGATVPTPAAAQPPSPAPPTPTPFIQVGPGVVPISTPTPLPTPTATLTPTATPELALSTQPYRNEEYQFSLRYPQGWQELAIQGLVVAFSAPQADRISGGQQFASNINVLVEPDVAGITLDEYLDDSLLTLRELLSNFQELSRRRTTLGSTPAYLLESTFDQGGFSLHILQAIVVRGNLGYVVTGTTHSATWASYSNILEASLRSFQFLAPAAAPTPAPAATGLTGFYQGTITNLTVGQTSPFDLQLHEEGTTIRVLSGYARVYPPLVGEGPVDGQASGTQLRFSVRFSYAGIQFAVSFEGNVSADGRTLSGTYAVSATGEVGTWRVTRTP